MWLHNGQTHGSSCLRKVQKRRRVEKSRKATRKRDLQRKAQRRQKDESEKEKGGGSGFQGSQTLCTPSTVDAIFCLAE